MPHTDDPDTTTTNNNFDDTDYNTDDNNVARMEADIISLEREMDSLEVEILAIQSENLAVKEEIESILQSPANIGRIEMGLLAVELLALKVLLTTLVKEEIHCKNLLKDRTDQVLTTAYELHALLKRQLVTRRKQLAEAQAKLQLASSRTKEAARGCLADDTDTNKTNSTTSTPME